MFYYLQLIIYLFEGAGPAGGDEWRYIQLVAGHQWGSQELSTGYSCLMSLWMNCPRGSNALSVHGQCQAQQECWSGGEQEGSAEGSGQDGSMV